MDDNNVTKDEKCMSEEDSKNTPSASMTSFALRQEKLMGPPQLYFSESAWVNAFVFSPPLTPSIIRSDPFADRLIEQGKIVEPWQHVMDTPQGFCKVRLPICGLQRKILTHLLEGRCPKKDDDEFSYLKDCNIKKYFKIRGMKPFHEIIIKSFDDFNKHFTTVACTDWSKITRDGESFGGPFKAPEGSKERNNAYQICREDNAKALWDTDYNPIALLYCVEYLCDFRCDEVAHVRDLCKWVCDFPKEKEEK